MFEPGISGNPAGRPVGTKNKINEVLRESINDFLAGSFMKVQEDFMSLKPYQRVRYWIELLNFSVPKLSAVQLQDDFEKLTDDQVDEIFNRLTNKANAAIKDQERES